MVTNEHPQKEGHCLRNACKGIQDNKKPKDIRQQVFAGGHLPNLPIYSLSMGERTGSLVLCSLWSYVIVRSFVRVIFFIRTPPVDVGDEITTHAKSGSLGTRKFGEQKTPL